MANDDDEKELQLIVIKLIGKPNKKEDPAGELLNWVAQDSCRIPLTWSYLKQRNIFQHLLKCKKWDALASIALIQSKEIVDTCMDMVVEMLEIMMTLPFRETVGIVQVLEALSTHEHTSNRLLNIPTLQDYLKETLVKSTFQELLFHLVIFIGNLADNFDSVQEMCRLGVLKGLTRLIMMSTTTVTTKENIVHATYKFACQVVDNIQEDVIFPRLLAYLASCNYSKLENVGEDGSEMNKIRTNEVSKIDIVREALWCIHLLAEQPEYCCKLGTVQGLLPALNQALLDSNLSEELRNIVQSTIELVASSTS